MKYIKSLLFWCMSCLFILLLADNVFADSTYTNPDSGYSAIIFDRFDELGVEDEESLLQQMGEITNTCNVAYVIEDVENNDRGTIDNSQNYLHGLFGEDSNSLIFYIDLNMLYIYAEGNISYVVTSSKAYSITDNAYPYAVRDDYYNCGKIVFEQVYKLTRGVNIPEPMKYLCNALLALMLGALLAYYLMSRELKNSSGLSTVMFTGGRAVLDSRDMAVVSTGRTRKIYHNTSSSGGTSHRRYRSHGGGHFGGGGHHSGGGHHR